MCKKKGVYVCHTLNIFLMSLGIPTTVTQIVKVAYIRNNKQKRVFFRNISEIRKSLLH